jgi:hypothetical protein
VDVTFSWKMMADGHIFDNVRSMGKLETIERTIEALPDKDLFALRKWFDELLEQRVDKWLEREVEAGRFDELAEEALADHKAGRTRPL